MRDEWRSVKVGCSRCGKLEEAAALTRRYSIRPNMMGDCWAEELLCPKCDAPIRSREWQEMLLDAGVVL